MARVLHDWLASFQELPIEGVGSLQWKRVPARRSSKTTLESPSWSLELLENPDASLPDDLFKRMAAFAQLSIPEVENQYQSWTRTFQGAESTVELWGMGKLVRNDAGHWSVDFDPHPAGPTASLKRLTLQPKHTYRRWTWGDRLVALLLVLVSGWLVWTGIEAGFHWGTELFKPSWKIEPSTGPASTYEEIR